MKARLPAILYLSLAALASAAVQPREIAFAVGHGWAVVREVRDLALTRGSGPLLLEDIPSQADLSSLTLRMERSPLKVQSWAWMDAGGPEEAGAWRREPGEVVWQPRAGDPGAPAPEVPSHTVLCVVDSPVEGVRPVELIYRVDGFDWTAAYQLVIRGGSHEAGEILAVDLTGYVQLVNPTRREFQRAAILLVGEDAVRGGAENQPGFLGFDEPNPLVDLWNDSRADPAPQYGFVLKGRWNLAPSDSTAVPLASARRMPLQRVFVLDARKVPLSGEGTLYPLDEVLVFRNAADAGLGRDLPAGPVEISRSDMREGSAVARMPRTPAEEPVRVSLGPAPAVLGSRRERGRKESSDREYEASNEVVVQNASGQAIDVEVSESPSPFEWDLVASNVPYIEKPTSVSFKLRVEAGGTSRIEYRVRVRRPGL